jgi:hypothetical protein
MHEMLPVVGVILAITLASAAQLHLEFNKIEERIGKIILNRTRAGVRGAAYMLIALFVGASSLVIIKPLTLSTELGQSICNALAIFILFFNIIILIEITQAAFSIPAHLEAK